MLIFLLILVTACSNGGDKTGENKTEGDRPDYLTDSGMPIVDEPLTLKFMAGKHATNLNDYNDVLLWKTYSEMTGIDIDWELMPFEVIEEKRNLALSSGTLPDVFYTPQIGNTDLFKYGEQGTFIKLTDLIEEHMPNLTSLLEKYPEVKKGMMFPDGEIYGLPSMASPEFTSVLIGSKFWIREDWLEQLGMDPPETTDELYDYFKAVKETDLNGNGIADEVPYGNYRMDKLLDWIKGSFGLQNRGMMNKFVDMDPETNEMRFYPVTEDYKSMLQYLNKLMSEGLILESIYTVDLQQSISMGSEGLYGSTLEASPALFGDELLEKYIGLPPFKGPNGDQIVSSMKSPLLKLGGMLITSENEHVEATLRWMDYFYSDEGTKMFFMGVEGISYEETEDGGVQYTEIITNNPDGLTVPQARAKYVTYAGGGYPGIVEQRYFAGGESSEVSLEITEKIEPLLVNEVWPEFTYTAEESKVLSSKGLEIEKYTEEMTDKFITGTIPFTEWDNYLDTLNSMGIDDYLSIKKDAYERYKDN